ncbi:alkene reductase [Magnetospirillum sp. UT-4]|uniref:oxidoreductase n=1 Tax=Magnetospirillum sp. UT-4 TaxID=2681467 RepID=UPI00137E00E1|nr:alkene reductase [Magnetospirillum sp. UT-4]CAA7621640.1 NADH-dependent flavin oxidoreductase, Oye family [Magnetospirillum sp. UT-4]
MKLVTPADVPVLGPVQSRVAMAAMTRSFAADHLATQAMLDYYRRRAADGVGLILTEGVIIHRSGDGYNNTPHIETDAQAESWRPVVAAVQAAGARIACQLWHCGRISHSDYTGAAPVSSTSRAAEGINRQNDKPFGTPRALEAGEMATVYGYYTDAAKRALAVGFDAVQLHFGHGYLADQFLDARVNDRTDSYGGSVENRCRFVLECLEAVMAAVPAGRVMVRISPSREMNGPYDWPDMEAMLDHLLPAFAARGLRMLDISCAAADYHKTSGRVIRMVRPKWQGLLIGGASLTPEQGEAELRDGLVDMVTWGRALIANPDFVSRVRSGRGLEAFDRAMLGELR